MIDSHWTINKTTSTTATITYFHIIGMYFNANFELTLPNPLIFLLNAICTLALVLVLPIKNDYTDHRNNDFEESLDRLFID